MTSSELSWKGKRFTSQANRSPVRQQAKMEDQLLDNDDILANLMEEAGGVNDANDASLGSTDWCQGCQRLREELEKMKAEHALNYTTLKEKIISTDLLIKKYTSKVQECELQSKKVEELQVSLEKYKRDCEVFEIRLKASLEETQPLKDAKDKLEVSHKHAVREINDLKDKMQSAQASQRMYSDAQYEHEKKMESLLAAKEEVVKGKKDLETLNKKQEKMIKKLQDEVAAKKTVLSEVQKQLRSVTKARDTLTDRLSQLDSKQGVVQSPRQRFSRGLRTRGPGPTRGGSRAPLRALRRRDEIVQRTIEDDYSSEEELLLNKLFKDEDVFEDDIADLFRPIGLALSPLPPSPHCLQEASLDDSEDELAEQLETAISTREKCPNKSPALLQRPKSPLPIRRSPRRTKLAGDSDDLDSDKDLTDTKVVKSGLSTNGVLTLQESLSDPEADNAADDRVPFQKFTSPIKEVQPSASQLVSDLQLSASSTSGSESDSSDAASPRRSPRRRQSTGSPGLVTSKPEDPPQTRRRTRSSSQGSSSGSELSDPGGVSVDSPKLPVRKENNNSPFKEPLPVSGRRARRRAVSCRISIQSPKSEKENQTNVSPDRRITRSISSPPGEESPNHSEFQTNDANSTMKQTDIKMEPMDDKSEGETAAVIPTPTRKRTRAATNQKSNSESAVTPPKMVHKEKGHDDAKKTESTKTVDAFATKDKAAGKETDLNAHVKIEDSVEQASTENQPKASPEKAHSKSEKESRKAALVAMKGITRLQSSDEPKNLPEKNSQGSNDLGENNSIQTAPESDSSCNARKLGQENQSLVKTTSEGFITQTFEEEDENVPLDDDQSSFMDISKGKDEAPQDQNVKSVFKIFQPESSAEETANILENTGGTTMRTLQIPSILISMASEDGSPEGRDFEDSPESPAPEPVQNSAPSVPTNESDTNDSTNHGVQVKIEQEDLTLTSLSNEKKTNDSKINNTESPKPESPSDREKIKAHENLITTKVIPTDRVLDQSPDQPESDSIQAVEDISGSPQVPEDCQSQSSGKGRGTLKRQFSVDSATQNDKKDLSDKGVSIRNKFVATKDSSIDTSDDKGQQGSTEQGDIDNTTGTDQSDQLISAIIKSEDAVSADQDSEQERPNDPPQAAESADPVQLNSIKQEKSEDRVLSLQKDNSLDEHESELADINQSAPGGSHDNGLPSGSTRAVRPTTLNYRPPSAGTSGANSAGFLPQFQPSPVVTPDGNSSMRSETPNTFRTSSVMSESPMSPLPPSPMDKVTQCVTPLSPMLPSDQSEVLSPLSFTLSDTEDLGNPISPLPPSPVPNARAVNDDGEDEESSVSGSMEGQANAPSVKSYNESPQVEERSLVGDVEVLSEIADKEEGDEDEEQQENNTGDHSPPVFKPRTRIAHQAATNSSADQPKIKKPMPTGASKDPVTSKSSKGKATPGIPSKSSKGKVVKVKDESQVLKESNVSRSQTPTAERGSKRTSERAVKRKSSDETSPSPVPNKVQCSTKESSSSTFIYKEIQSLVRLRGGTSVNLVVQHLVRNAPKQAKIANTVDAIIKVCKTQEIDLLSSLYTLCSKSTCDVTWQPFVADHESRIIQLIQVLTTKHKSMFKNLVNVFLGVASEVILRSDEASVLVRASLSRIYTGLCRQLGLNGPVRILLFDMVAMQVTGYPTMTVAIAGVWPQILQKQLSGTQTLICTLEHVVMRRVTGQKVRLSKLDLCLRTLCQWAPPSEETSATSLAKQILQDLNTETAKSTINRDVICELEEALILIARTEEWRWTNNTLIVETMWPCLQSWAAAKIRKTHTDTCDAMCESLVRLMGHIVSRCPPPHNPATDVMNMMRPLVQGVPGAVIPPNIQQVAMETLLWLAPFQALTVAETAHIWLKALQASQENQTGANVMKNRNTRRASVAPLQNAVITRLKELIKDFLKTYQHILQEDQVKDLELLLK